ncbi:hypothetical protein MKW94_008105 [Papaver nudicaule]|uniref:Uncharacterized protein n=1 Tax=Papaver nudicaule TaxID=74823 RepID=A0AA42B3D8_PAPNU|nr:hypothetical protein [Papaver nudicaule]
MEEIERIHKKNSSAASSKHKNSEAKKSTWAEALGFKKDVMQFLTCLKGFKVDFRCFGNFHGSGVLSDDDDEDDDDVNEDEENDEVRSELGKDHLTSSCKSSRTVYSKWFMVLEENKENGLFEENKDAEKNVCPSAAPPPNALLLMRCRSAPAKSWLEEKEEEEEEEEEEHEDDQESKDYNNNKLKVVFDEEQKKENLILKCYSPDFTMVSSDVAKETWVVGGIRDSRDPLSRSRSWKR